MTFGIQIANFNFTGGSNRNNQRADLPLPPAHEGHPGDGVDLGLEDDDQIYSRSRPEGPSFNGS